MKTKDLVFVTCQPDDTHFMWEVEVQINNLRKYELSDKLKVLVYWERRDDKPMVNFQWLMLARKYPEVEFMFYKNDENDLPISVTSTIYVSALRPYCLKKFWKSRPEMKDKAVFYLDSDVIFIKRPDIDQFIDDDISYVSSTRGYLGIDYMRSKAIEAGLDKDHFIEIAANIIGIDKQVIIDNDVNCGGAQYLLKNISSEFWQKVQDDCVMIRQRFMFENRRHFQELGAKRKDKSVENAGIQSWCADMWAVLYNLYFFGIEVNAPKELDFIWATDKLEEASKDRFILHNAGVGNDNNHFLFDKTRYRFGQKYVERWPYEENFDYVSSEYGSSLYVQEIKETYKQQIDELQKMRAV